MAALNNNLVPPEVLIAAPAPINPGNIERLTITKSYLNAVFNCAECTLLSTAAKITIIALPLIIALTLIADLIASCFTYENTQIELPGAPLPAAPVGDVGPKPDIEQPVADPVVKELAKELTKKLTKTVEPKTVIQVDPAGTAHVLERGVEQVARTLLSPKTPLDVEDAQADAEETKVEEVPVAPIFMKYLEDVVAAPAAEPLMPAPLVPDPMAPVVKAVAPAPAAIALLPAPLVPDPMAPVAPAEDKKAPEIAPAVPALNIVVVGAGAQARIAADGDGIVVRGVLGHEPALPAAEIVLAPQPQLPAGHEAQIDQMQDKLVKWASFVWSWTGEPTLSYAKQAYNNPAKTKADVNAFMKDLANKCCKGRTVVDDEVEEAVEAPALVAAPVAIVVPVEEKAPAAAPAIPARRARRKKSSLTHVLPQVDQ